MRNTRGGKETQIQKERKKNEQKEERNKQKEN